jgi:hypothetical protein
MNLLVMISLYWWISYCFLREERIALSQVTRRILNLMGVMLSVLLLLPDVRTSTSIVIIPAFANTVQLVNPF